MAKLEKPVLMAVVGGAHGTGGDVRVKPFTGDPAALDAYGLLYDKTGKHYRIRSLRLQKTVLVVRFEGVDTRAQAEALNGTRLFIERGQLPDDLADDEFYHNDLIGFKAFDCHGQEIGRVTAFFNFGGGDILELALKGGAPRLIPFSRAAVPHIDMSAGQIVVDRVAAGLGPDGDEGAPGT